MPLSTQRRLRCLPWALALVLTLAGMPAPAHAAPSAAALASKREQAAQEAAKLQTMRAELARKLASYRTVNASLSRTRQEIADNTARLRILEERLGVARSGLDVRADYLYRSRGSGLLTVLFSAVTFEEFITRLDIVAQIATQDARLVRQIRDATDEATRLRGTLKERETMLAGLQRTADAERGRIEGDIVRQQSTVGSLDADVARILRDAERADAARRGYADPVSNRPSSGSGGSKPSGGSTSLVAVSVAQHPGVKFLAMKGSASTYSATGVTFSGKASIYSVAENGTGTASGRPLNDNELTCAHPSLPFGTRLALTRGSHHIIVVVTDRGPYTGGRVLDLTVRAASILNIDGVGSVTAEVVEPQ